jgi:hypothetical protein
VNTKFDLFFLKWKKKRRRRRRRRREREGKEDRKSELLTA